MEEVIARLLLFLIEDVRGAGRTSRAGSAMGGLVPLEAPGLPSIGRRCRCLQLGPQGFCSHPCGLESRHKGETRNKT